MTLGKVIKAGSKQYRTVEDIDIFNLRQVRQILELKIPVVKEASSEVRSIFVDDEEVEHIENSDKDVYSDETVAVKETVTIETSEIERMSSQIEELKNMIAAKDNQILEIRKNFRAEGYERGRVEGSSKGQVEAQKEAVKVIENIKNSFDSELLKLKSDSDELWQSVIEFVRKALFKLAGKSLEEKDALSIIEKIRASFPDESKLSIRVSPDLFTIFSQINREGIAIVKDVTMEPKSVVAELAEGIADFSLKTQVEKVIKWLAEDENV